MASIDYNGVTIPLIDDPDDWNGREIFAVERMVAGGIQTAETFGQLAAVVGISIARVMPTFVFPDEILTMKGRDLGPLVKNAMESIDTDRKQRQAEAELAAKAIEGEVLSPTSAASEEPSPAA